MQVRQLFPDPRLTRTHAHTHTFTHTHCTHTHTAHTHTHTHTHTHVHIPSLQELFADCLNLSTELEVRKMVYFKNKAV